MFSDNLHSLLRDLKQPFFKEVIQQKAIKDSFYSRISEGHSNSWQEVCNISPDDLDDDGSPPPCLVPLIVLLQY